VKAISLIFVAAIAAGPDTPIIGRASVVDGDTIEIHGQRIRLNGVDAPESGQRCRDAAGVEYRCGREAAEALDAFLAAARPTLCTVTGRDRYRRYVADCTRSDGSNVAAWLVKNGYALDWPLYSKGAYAADQTRAQTSRAGIWKGSFEMPWDWRKMKR